MPQIITTHICRQFVLGFRMVLTLHLVQNIIIYFHPLFGTNSLYNEVSKL